MVLKVRGGFSTEKLNHLIENLKTKGMSSQFRIFSIVFIAAFFTPRPIGGSGSTGSVEQWLNLTNAVFDGNLDFLFSYGPLYWLTGGSSSPYSLGTWITSSLYVSVTFGIYWTLVWSLRRNLDFVFFLIAIAIVVASQGIFPNSAMYMWPVLALPFLSRIARSPGVSRTYLWILLGTYVGLAFYVRFFFGVIAGLAFGLWLFVHCLRLKKYRSILVFSFCAAVSYVVIGTLIFREKISIIRYMLFNLQLSFGNAVDMTYDIQADWLVMAGFLILALLIILKSFKNYELALPVTAVLFILFKLGFGRADHTISYLIPTLPLLALLVNTRSQGKNKVLQITMVALSICITLVPNYSGAPTLQLVRDAAYLGQPYSQRMADLYPKFILDETTRRTIGDSSVDIYPYFNEIAFANKLNYLPRPSFQSYMTLTPFLGEANASFLNSEKAPKFIIWTAGATCSSPACNVFDAFDGKYVLNEDPVTAHSILSNYEKVSQGKLSSGLPFLLLAKADSKTPVPNESVKKIHVGQLGQWLKVPVSSAGAVRLLPSLELSRVAVLKNTFFRGNVAYVTYKLSNGEEHRYRLNILNAEMGVWATPFLSDFTLSGSRVSEIRLDSQDWYIMKSFNYSWQFLDGKTLLRFRPE